MSTSATTPARPTAPESPRRRTPVGLWIWGFVSLGFGAAGTGILSLCWLAALEEPGGALIFELFAIAWLLPAISIALSGIVLAILAIVKGRLGLLFLALGSPVCQLPLAFAIFGTSFHEVLW